MQIVLSSERIDIKIIPLEKTTSYCLKLEGLFLYLSGQGKDNASNKRCVRGASPEQLPTKSLGKVYLSQNTLVTSPFILHNNQCNGKKCRRKTQLNKHALKDRSKSFCIEDGYFTNLVTYFNKPESRVYQ